MEDFITILLVVRNEKSAVRECIQSLISQTWYHCKTELIMIDGHSTDGTREEMTKIQNQLSNEGWQCRLLDNPQKILATGWNIGIKNARGNFICRIDAHSSIAPDYIELGITELNKPGREQVVGIGGILRQKQKNETFVGRVIDEMLTSRFGVGNSPFRVPPKQISETDTAVFAIYRRQPLLDIGGLNENMVRNQDNEFHNRLIQAQWKFLTHPEMKATYQPRSTFIKLMKQGFSNGFWIVFSGGSLRHFIPFYFVLYLFVCLLFSLFLPQYLIILGLIPLILYFLLGIIFSLKDGKSCFTQFVLPLFFFCFHLVYGLGTLRGLIHRIITWFLQIQKSNKFVKNISQKNEKK
jgi:glycosyltransferase involved in cell wall biosynthesis